MIHPTIRPPQATDNGHIGVDFRLIGAHTISNMEKMHRNLE